MYAGPLGREPIAVELHNTRYVAGGVRRDGLAEDAASWLEALGDRIPAGPWPGVGELVALRDAIRTALAGPDAAALAAINSASARAPFSPKVERAPNGDLVATVDHHGATSAEIVLAAFARDAIELLTGARELRACGAPGCILLFVKDHPRREWCSNACGNRARQARHYDRVRRR